MTWVGGTVCPSTLSRVSPRKWALLQVGMMTVTLEGRIFSPQLPAGERRHSHRSSPSNFRPSGVRWAGGPSSRGSRPRPEGPTRRSHWAILCRRSFSYISTLGSSTECWSEISCPAGAHRMYWARRGRSLRLTPEPCGRARCQMMRSPALASIVWTFCQSRGGGALTSRWSSGRSRPFDGFAVHPGDAVESSVVGRAVRQAQDALEAELDGALLEIHVPMEEGRIVPVGMFRTDRRFHRGAVEAHPELPGLPQLAEGAVDPGALAIVPKRLVLMHLDQSVGRMGRPVPVVRLGRIHAEELPDRVGRGGNLFGRHGAGQRDITLCLEMLEILGGEHLLSREGLCRHAFTFSSTGAPHR